MSRLKELRSDSPFTKGKLSADKTKANKRKACQAAYAAGFSNRIKQMSTARFRRERKAALAKNTIDKRSQRAYKGLA